MRLTLFLLLCLPVAALPQKMFSFKHDERARRIDLLYGGQLLTSHCAFDSVAKPVLFPLNTVLGTTVTRGYPVAPRAGERTDHPHHAGLWLNYESVNGLDFWNNSPAIPPSKRAAYGSIRLKNIIGYKADGQQARLSTVSDWVDHSGKVILEEHTVYRFAVQANTFIIDRFTRLKALDSTVVFRDVKDGMLGLRVARPLEMPSAQEDRFVDEKGNITVVPAADNTGVTGMYYNREGVRGDEAWGKRSAWTCLAGRIGDELVTIGMIDHPANTGYPTYWHVRGYGLFAANPLGQKVFSNGARELNLTLKKNDAVEFRYRIIVHSGSVLSNAEMDTFMTRFSNIDANYFKL